jgi:hypothetical protein
MQFCGPGQMLDPPAHHQRKRIRVQQAPRNLQPSAAREIGLFFPGLA